MSARSLIVGALAIAGGLTLGCREQVKPTPAPAAPLAAPPTARGGGPPSGTVATDQPTIEGALDKLSSARCAKEVRCGRIGPKGSYETRQQCIDADAMNKFDALDPQNCPDGVRTEQLAACLQALRSERCDSDSLTRGCTLQALCVK